MDGLQEVPPNASPAFGSADLTLDTTTGLVTITTGTYQDLLGNSTAVTINDAAAGANGLTQFVLTLDAPGNNTGTFSGGGTLANNTIIQDMLNGNTYVNLRSNVFPSGEIRGQISVAPEPASLGLLAGAGLLLVRRRVHIA